EMHAVAQEAVNPPRGDDPRDVPVAEPQLEHGGAHARGAGDRRLRVSVVEGAEQRQDVPIPDRDAAARVAHAENAGIEVLRLGSGHGSEGDGREKDSDDASCGHRPHYYTRGRGRVPSAAPT